MSSFLLEKHVLESCWKFKAGLLGLIKGGRKQQLHTETRLAPLFCFFSCNRETRGYVYVNCIYICCLSFLHCLWFYTVSTEHFFHDLTAAIGLFGGNHFCVVKRVQSDKTLFEAFSKSHPWLYFSTLNIIII